MYNNPTLLKIVSYFRKNWFIFFALIVYGFFTLYYMGPSVTSCTTTVYGFGDNTAGPIWQASLPEVQGPIGSYTSMTNAPYGDNLESPIGYSLIAQSLYIKAVTAIAGPICGYNIANITGFMLSAFVMFAFVYAVTKRRWIALVAGYAVSFAPYFQLKIGAHFSFGFQAIFIGILWSFFNLIDKRRKRDAALLATLTALGIYWDPYYSILVALIIFPLAITWLVLNRSVFLKRFWTARGTGAKTKSQLKLLAAVAGMVALLIMPLGVVLATQGKQISDNVSTSRGNILLETFYCSNWPHEYLVPFMYNPVFEKAFGKEIYNTSINVLRDHYSCGIGEDIVGVSIALAVVLGLGFVVMFWERINKRRLRLLKTVRYEPRFLVFGLAAILIACLLLSFPPISRGGLSTPSFEMLQITSTWRTITRVFVVFNIALVALASIVMAYFVSKFSSKKQKTMLGVLLAIIFGFMVIEYQTARTPFSGNTYGTFDYTTSVPTHYQWLKGQADISTIAEYPLERSGGEGNSMAYYLSMQVAHGKKLFNGSVGYTAHEKKKTGLKNLRDPQTVPVLKAMGVDAIVLHGVTLQEAQSIPYGEIIHASKSNGFTVVGFSPLVQLDDVYVLSLKNVPVKQSYIIAPQEGYYRNMTYVRSATDWRYLAASKNTLSVMGLDGGQLSQPEDVCFDIRTAGEGVYSLNVSADGAVAQRIQIGAVPVAINLKAQNKVVLDSDSPDGVVVSKLGCTR